MTRPPAPRPPSAARAVAAARAHPVAAPACARRHRDAGRCGVGAGPRPADRAHRREPQLRRAQLPRGFLKPAAPLAIVALGQYFVIVSGEFDLSMGAVIALQVVIAGELIAGPRPDLARHCSHAPARRGGRRRQRSGHHGAQGAELHRHPRHDARDHRLVDHATGGSNKQNPVDEYRDLGRGGFEDVPVVENLDYSVIVLVVLCVLAAWVMRTPFGRSLLAVGDNPDAARFAGSSPVWLKTRAFVLSSLSPRRWPG